MSEPTGVLFLNARSGIADDTRTEKIYAAAKNRGLEVVEIDPNVDISEIVRDAIAGGCGLFLAAGGDGTVHHVMQSLVNIPARLAVVPIGTMNRMAKDLGIPLDWEQALDLAFTGALKQIDVGAANGSYFANTIFLGLYADMVRERERLRWYGKTLAYLNAIYKSLVRFHSVTLGVQTGEESQVIRTPMFAITVNEYEFDAPGLMATRSSFDSGVLALYWLPRIRRAAVMRIAIKFVGGGLRLGTDLATLNTREVKVQSRHPIARIGMDGELVTMKMPMAVSIVPGGLRVVVPHESPASALRR